MTILSKAVIIYPRISPTIPPHNPHHHVPLHSRASRIHLTYDDAAVARMSKIYGDVPYVVSVIEGCPPEIRLTLAMLLEIKVDLSSYPNDSMSMVRFEVPFLDDKNREVISRALDCGESDTALSIYNSCPPEQTLLALAVAYLKQAESEE